MANAKKTVERGHYRLYLINVLSTAQGHYGTELETGNKPRKYKAKYEMPLANQ